MFRFLGCFQDQMMTDDAYFGRLARHYDQFKDALENPGHQTAPCPSP